MPTIEELENKLNAAASQYEQVVKQNQSLQQELKEIKELVLKDPVSLRDVLVSECVASEYENETRNKIVEFLTEMSSQDNRGTAFPYYYTVADERERFESDKHGEYFFYSCEGEMRLISDALKEMFNNNDLELNESDDFEGDILKNIGNICEDCRINDWLEKYNNFEYVSRATQMFETYYEGVFLTETDAKAYLESTSNHHFGPNPRTYVDSFNHWGRHSKTEEFLKNLFEYFGVKVPPKMYYESKGVDYKYD